MTSMLLSVLLLASVAAAPTTRPDPDDGKGAGEAETGRGVLSGPVVDRKAQSERPATFGTPDRMQRGVPVRPRPWIAAVREVELDDEQRVKITGIWNEYDAAVRKHARDHAGEYAELRNAYRDAATEQEKAEIRAKRRRIGRTLPRFDPYRVRVIEALDEAQRVALRTILEERAKSDKPLRRRVRRDMQPPKLDLSRSAPPQSTGTDKMGERRAKFLRSKRKG